MRMMEGGWDEVMELNVFILPTAIDEGMLMLSKGFDVGFIDEGMLMLSKGFDVGFFNSGTYWLLVFKHF